MARDRDRDEGLPPPIRGARRGPEMREDQIPPGAFGRLSRLADMGAETDMGGDEQAAQLVLSAAQQLNQAAQLQPQLQPVVDRIMNVLRSGMGELAGEAGGVGGEEEFGMREEPSTAQRPKQKRKRIRPPRAETEPEEESPELMGMSQY